MIVAIDIGNTNITVAFMDGPQLLKSYRLTTKLQRTSDEYGFYLRSFLEDANLEVYMIEEVLVSTVVPKIMYSFNHAIKKYLKHEPINIDARSNSGIQVITDSPASVGADRIVDAAGAFYTYGGPCLVIDFGTATTFDYVNEKGEFRYAVTAPGLEITAQALSNMAAQLPEIEIKKPASILATNTISSMQAGVVYGYIGLTREIITKVQQEIGTPMKVIATGGLGRMISEELECIDVYDSELTFKGLYLIYLHNKEK